MPDDACLLEAPAQVLLHALSVRVPHQAVQARVPQQVAHPRVPQ